MCQSLVESSSLRSAIWTNHRSRSNISRAVRMPKRDQTVRLREGKSGHNKRQCTLQIAVFADGVMHCKLLLMFKGKPKGDNPRKAEQKRYHLGVVVIFNKKAWANTSNLPLCPLFKQELHSLHSSSILASGQGHSAKYCGGVPWSPIKIT
jgi:hypothetical protein